MDFKSITTIWKKELRDTVRDKRTLFSMIVIPMLLLPGLLIGMVKFVQSQESKQSQQTLKIALVGGQYSPDIADVFKNQKKFEIVDAGADLKAAVADGKVDAAVIIPEDFQAKIDGQQPVKVDFISKSTNMTTSGALVSLSTAVTDFNNKLIQKRFSDQKVNPDILSNVTINQQDAATQKEVGGFVLGLLIPIFIVMWSIVGGQYTAIDVSAGEKERKTLEALLLTPVRRIDIVLGKFLAVSTVALISIITALGSLYFSFLAATKMGIPLQANTGANVNMPGGSNMLASGTGFNLSVDPQVALLLFIVSIFLVLMFSAVILSISIFAKSFKEAESYISPAYIVVIMPVVFINAVPGFQATLWFFVVPAVNAVLLFKELLMGTYIWSHILLTLGSLIIYSALAIFAATKIYSQENVLFRD